MVDFLHDEEAVTARRLEVKPEVFPYNPHAFDGDEISVMYFIPWMVMGGADLYDLNVLSSIQSPKTTSSSFRTTLIVSRYIDFHPWSHLFEPLVDEVFNLQALTNSTNATNFIVDYLAESRGSAMAVNSRTVAGYDAFERWATATDGVVPRSASDAAILKPNASLIDHRRLLPRRRVDILHLHHKPPDNSNWEHRSARTARALTLRVVVSRHLKEFLANDLGLGDRELGVVGKRSTPLTGEYKDRIVVIPPPLQMSFKEHDDMMTDGTKTGKPTVFFVGRFDDQKDPLLWLNVGSAVISKWDWERRPSLVMIGSGPLERAIRAEAKREPNLFNSLKIIMNATENHQVLRELRGPSRSVMVLTSRLEGVPIAAMESVASGVPVVMLECGGVSELFEDGITGAATWDWVTVARTSVMVMRTRLVSIVQSRCEDVDGPRGMRRVDVVDVLAEEARRFLTGGDTRSVDGASK
ncbi:hypothetical protein HK101_005209 [Irineochytrium annulatum]|nr:hypothetical protein HK101_005209 [Irineochytrium annulatum]